jgi:hypothetical protein
MSRHISFRGLLLASIATVTLTLVFTQSATAEVIDFESFSGPSLFGGPLQNLNIATSIGTVTVKGGTILTSEANLPADTSSVYGTAGVQDGGLPYLDPITITFPSAITNFFLNVYNGNTTNVDYTVADNAGHSQTFNLASNFDGGESLVAIPATGNVITIYASPIQSDTIWDFSIDNITFNQALPQTAEPMSAGLLGLAFGLSGVGVLRRRLRTGRL